MRMMLRVLAAAGLIGSLAGFISLADRLLAVAPPTGGGAVCCTLAASGGGTSDGSPGSASVTLNVPSGSLIWVGCWGQGNDPTTTISASDTAGNTGSFTQIAQTQNGGGEMYSWYVKNAAGNAADVITCTSTNSAFIVTVLAHVYTGASTTAPLDAFADAGAGNGPPLTSGTFSTSVANTVVAAIGETNNGGAVLSAGSGYTGRVDGNAFDHITFTEDQVFTSTQTNITATMANTIGGGMLHAAAFK